MFCVRVCACGGGGAVGNVRNEKKNTTNNEHTCKI